MAKKKSKYGISWPAHPLTGQFIPPEEYREVIRQLKAAEDAKEQAIIDAKQNVQVYRELEGLYTPDALDQAITEWKETGNQEEFMDNAWPHLRRVIKGFAKQVLVTKMKQETRQIFLDCTNTYDHTEWLSVVMMKAIRDWKPKLQKHFAPFLKKRCEWYGMGINRKANRDYMEGITLTLCRFEEDDEKMISQALNENYTTNKIGQLFMDDNVEDFLDTLTELQRSFYTNLVLNSDEQEKEKRMTQEELAKHLGYSLSKLKRKRQELGVLWIKFMEERKSEYTNWQ